MPTTRTVTAYTFDELSDSAKDKAREWMRRCVGEDYDWADGVECDAANVGLKITGWNLDRGASCSLEFVDSTGQTADLILKDHLESSDTYKAARTYRDAIDELERNEEREDDQEERDRLHDAFLADLQHEYLTMLRKEWEYRLSDEAIDEDIRANEYLFTEEGRRSATL